MDPANLRQLAELGRRFDVLPGLTDLQLGTTASVAAIALGACEIEKRSTLSDVDNGTDSK
jgi:sialic acid synthase SpsE